MDDDDGPTPDDYIVAEIKITKFIRGDDVLQRIDITPDNQLPISEVLGILVFAQHSYAADNIEPAPREDY